MYRVLSGLACLILLSVLTFAQSDRGTITGTVLDPAGAVVASAPIQARNPATGVTYDGATSATGNYTLTQLPPGTYELSITVPGFKKYTRSGLEVQVAQTYRIDIALEVGSATESVTVTEAAPLLRTESGDLSHNIRATDMNTLPILGIGGTQSGSAGIRNPYAMVQMIPGAAWIPNSNVRINGAPSNTQSWRIEGQDASNSGTPGVPQQSQPSVDAIEEVAIQTSNYSAEYGQVGGGLFNVTMRSGTNRFHGSAYDYFVNEIFNAGQPLSNNPVSNPRPRARRHDYGFTFGGPVFIPKVYDGHDKTFFFFNWEQFRETTSVENQQQTIPTSAFRAGDFGAAVTNRSACPAANVNCNPAGGGLLEGQIFDPLTARLVNGVTVRDQFPLNRIPIGRFDPVAVKIQALFPATIGPNANAITNNYVVSYGTNRLTQVPSIKVDQQIGTKGKLAFFYQKTRTENPNGNTIFGQSDGLPDPLTTALGTFQNAPLYRLNYDHSLTPTVLLHLGAGYRSNYFLVPSVTTTGEITNYNAEQQLGLKGAIDNTFFPPMNGLLSTVGTGGMKNIGSSANSNQITQSPSFNAYLTWVKSNHTFKFGGEFRTEGYPPRIRGNTAGTYTFATNQTAQPFQNVPGVGGANTGFGYASFLLGLVNQVSIANPTFPRIGKKQLGVYAQDTWKITRKFTLDYGIRYDYATYLQEQYGRAPNFSPDAIHPKLGIKGASVYDGDGPGRCGCNIAQNYPFAAAPRLGMAYQITPKTVLRAGFGIVYSSTAANNNAGGTLANSTATTAAAVFGAPVTTLAQGIPVSFRPVDWPSYDPAFFPTASPIPGPGPVYMDRNGGRPARQYQWSIGIQRELTRDLVVEASYVANRGVWWQSPGSINLNAISYDTLRANGLDPINNAADRTLLTSFQNSQTAISRGFNRPPYPGFPAAQTVAQSLRPYPQFTNISVFWPPIGKTWYDSLQIKATKRMSYGLTFLSTFTWQKALANGTEIGEPNPATTGNAVFNDVFNRPNNKYLSQYDQPRVFNVSVQYTTPTLSGNKYLSWLVKDWTPGAFLQYASGQPLVAPSAQTAPNINTMLFQDTFANRVPGVPLFTQDLNCHCYDPNKTFVLNPAAWADPAAGTFGTSAAYYNDYRRQRRPIENVNLGRTFRVGEKVTFNIRAEFTNIFNRAFWADPSAAALTNYKLPQTYRPNGNTNAGFGMLGTTTQLSTANLLPRQGVIVGRVTF